MPDENLAQSAICAVSPFGELKPPYSTIVADPPWRYRTSSGITTRTSHGRSCAEDNYSTMSNAELAALPVADLAADDAALFMWVTNPKLYGARKGGEPNPAEIAEAWGFRYVTLLTWVKQGALGLGFYFRGMTEHVLFCTRGRFRIPAQDRQRNVFETGDGGAFQAPKVGHSIKPGAFLDLVEASCPGPYLELFARAPRLGWDAWGHGFEVASA